MKKTTITRKMKNGAVAIISSTLSVADLQIRYRGILCFYPGSEEMATATTKDSGIIMWVTPEGDDIIIIPARIRKKIRHAKKARALLPGESITPSHLRSQIGSGEKKAYGGMNMKDWMNPAPTNDYIKRGEEMEVQARKSFASLISARVCAHPTCGKWVNREEQYCSVECNISDIDRIMEEEMVECHRPGCGKESKRKDGFYAPMIVSNNFG